MRAIHLALLKSLSLSLFLCFSLFADSFKAKLAILHETATCCFAHDFNLRASISHKIGQTTALLVLAVAAAATSVVSLAPRTGFFYSLIWLNPNHLYVVIVGLIALSFSLPRTDD